MCLFSFLNERVDALDMVGEHFCERGEGGVVALVDAASEPGGGGGGEGDGLGSVGRNGGGSKGRVFWGGGERGEGVGELFGFEIFFPPVADEAEGSWKAGRRKFEAFFFLTEVVGIDGGG